MFEHHGPARRAAPAPRCSPRSASTGCPATWPARWRCAKRAPRRSASRSATSPAAAAPAAAPRRSGLQAAIEPSFAYRGGRLRSERTGAHVRTFELEPGKERRGVSVGGSEHFGLPAVYPTLRDVDVILGMAGSLTPAMPLITGVMGTALRLPPLRAGARAALGRLAKGSTGGPDEEARERKQRDGRRRGVRRPRLPADDRSPRRGQRLHLHRRDPRLGRGEGCRRGGRRQPARSGRSRRSASRGSRPGLRRPASKLASARSMGFSGALGRWWVLLALYVVLAVLVTWPLTAHLGGSLTFGGELARTVPLLNLWTLEWNQHAIGELYAGYWDAPIFHPVQGAFALSEPQPLTGLAFAALGWLSGNPVLAYNLVALAILALNGLAGARLARALGRRRRAGRADRRPRGRPAVRSASDGRAAADGGLPAVAVDRGHPPVGARGREQAGGARGPVARGDLPHLRLLRPVRGGRHRWRASCSPGEAGSPAGGCATSPSASGSLRCWRCRWCWGRPSTRADTSARTRRSAS